MMSDKEKKVVPEGNVLPLAQAEHRPSDFEDTEQELEEYSQTLKDALACFQNSIGNSFNVNDESAQKHQRRHRSIIKVFSVSGTLAVVFSILHLTRLLPFQEHSAVKPFLAYGLFGGEALAVMVAGLAFIAGVVMGFQGNWLEKRHKAEMLRLLKFSSIINPAVLSGDATAFKKWKRDLLDDVRSIESINSETLHEWVEEGRIPNLPAPPLTFKIEEQTVQDLLDYYRKKRLQPQATYFYGQAKRNLHLDWSTRLLPPALFILSVLFALLHLTLEIFEISHFGKDEFVANWTRQVSPASVIFIILAAILPVLSAGLRGLRSAFELSRNTLRFQALHFTLEMLRERLQKETRPEEILRDLWWCEWLLEAEHREWLRLMIEVEWAG